MNTRAQVLRFISGHIVHGRNVKIMLDGEELRLQICGFHHIWHNDNKSRIVAVIDVELFKIVMSDKWADLPVEFYDI